MAMSRFTTGTQYSLDAARTARLRPVEEALADQVALVVLVDAVQPSMAFHMIGWSQAFWNAVPRNRGGSHPSSRARG